MPPMKMRFNLILIEMLIKVNILTSTKEYFMLYNRATKKLGVLSPSLF